MRETLKRRRGRPRKDRKAEGPITLPGAKVETPEAAPSILEAQEPMSTLGDTTRTPEVGVPGPQKSSNIIRPHWPGDVPVVMENRKRLGLRPLSKKDLEITVRRFEPIDLIFINEIRSEWKLRALSRNDFIGTAIVAENSHGPVGYIWACVLPDGTAVVDNFGVSRNYTNRGRGAKPNRVGFALYEAILFELTMMKVRRIFCAIEYTEQHLLRLVVKLWGKESHNGLFHVFVREP